MEDRVFISFIRHGESQSNISGVITGWGNPSLTEKGKRHLERICIPPGVEEIWRGDLLRYEQSCDILNEKLLLPVIQDQRLRERHLGSLEGRRWRDFPNKRVILKADLRLRYNYRPYGGESVEDVQGRIFRCINVMRSSGRKHILAITSAGVIGLLVLLLEGKFSRKIKNGEIRTFEFPDTPQLR